MKQIKKYSLDTKFTTGKEIYEAKLRGENIYDLALKYKVSTETARRWANEWAKLVIRDSGKEIVNFELDKLERLESKIYKCMNESKTIDPKLVKSYLEVLERRHYLTRLETLIVDSFKNPTVHIVIPKDFSGESYSTSKMNKEVKETKEEVLEPIEVEEVEGNEQE